MDIGSILLGLALFAAVAFFIARPFLEQVPAGAGEPSLADRLQLQHETLLSQLRDLDFDQATGKITDEDYAPQRARLVAEGVEVLRQLDALDPRAGDPIERAVAARRRPAAPVSVEDEIEAAAAALRRAPAGPVLKCPHCAATAREQDRFCPGCGQALVVACPGCGRDARVGDQFCGKCGASLPSQGDPRQARVAG